jgi:hypothetical protein
MQQMKRLLDPSGADVKQQPVKVGPKIGECPLSLWKWERSIKIV